MIYKIIAHPLKIINSKICRNVKKQKNFFSDLYRGRLSLAPFPRLFGAFSARINVRNFIFVKSLDIPQR